MDDMDSELDIDFKPKTLNSILNMPGHKPREVKDTVKAVVIAEKMCHKGQLFGHISNGDGILNLSNGKSIKFVCENDKFVLLQLLDSGIGKEIKSQTWRKGIARPKAAAKTPKPKIEKKKIEVNEKIKKLTAF